MQWSWHCGKAMALFKSCKDGSMKIHQVQSQCEIGVPGASRRKCVLFYVLSQERQLYRIRKARSRIYKTTAESEQVRHYVLQGIFDCLCIRPVQLPKSLNTCTANGLSFVAAE